VNAYLFVPAISFFKVFLGLKAYCKKGVEALLLAERRFNPQEE
jgi:hypothetical protein